MKTLQSLLVAAALAIGMSAPVSAAQSDPEVIIYRFPGVLDRGTTNSGPATSFHCTNFSGANENVRIVIRIAEGQLVANQLYSIGHLGTLTASTKSTNLFMEQFLLGAAGALVEQGTAAIA